MACWRPNLGSALYCLSSQVYGAAKAAHPIWLHNQPSSAQSCVLLVHQAATCGPNRTRCGLPSALVSPILLPNLTQPTLGSQVYEAAKRGTSDVTARARESAREGVQEASGG